MNKHRSALSVAGLPPTILENARTWHYVVLHGDDELQSGWNPSWLSPVQASHVHEIIKESPFSDMASEFLRVLDQRRKSRD